jgi:hypothetical protein
MFELRAEDFAINTMPYGFNLDAKRTADALRRFADAIDGGDIALQTAKVISAASVDEFAMNELQIVFARKVNEPKL